MTSPPDRPPSPPLDPLALTLLTLAVALPPLLALSISPSATVINQIASLALWGLLVTAASGQLTRRPLQDAAALLTALIFIAAACLWSWARNTWPAPLALSVLAFVAAATVVALHGASQRGGAAGGGAFFVAWVVAGVLSSGIALVQVFQPDWADGQLIARSGLTGRAVGNVRQPNHLSGLLLWSAVAIVPLVERRGRLRLRLALPMFALLVFGIELSASRTGLIGVAVLAAWGMADRRLARGTRLMLCLAPLVYAVGWYAMSWWAADGQHTFGAASRLAEKDVSGSRFGIWSNTLALIRMVPWTGVGFGEFNYAWSLTPFPGRPTAFFDHTHNLGLQLLVELGVPLGSLVIGLLLLALWQAFARTWKVEGPEGAALRAAFVGVLLASIHSALEYPLWYGYFLLPTAWAWGYALGGRAAPRQGSTQEAVGPPLGPLLRIAGVLMVAGSVFAMKDYLRVAAIFDPAEDAKPLEQRIAEGQRSAFFAHHADYAAATVAEHPSEAWSAFGRAPYYLLDTRLMMAWAK
ncbi:MAG: Wzy polymerase domain-containing protein, partial [Pseudomonadota bacterium]